MLLIRTDGQPIRGNPKHEASLQVDQTVCLGERQKAQLSGTSFNTSTVGAVIDGIERNRSADTVMAGCLAQRGYLIVPAAEADARAASLREIAATDSAGSTTATGSISASPAPTQK